MNSRKFKTIFLWHLSIKSKFLLLPVSTQFIFGVTCRICEKVHCFFLSSVIFRKWRSQLGMVSHARYLSYLRRLRQEDCCVWGQDQPGLHSLTLLPTWRKKGRWEGRKEKRIETTFPPQESENAIPVLVWQCMDQGASPNQEARNAPSPQRLPEAVQGPEDALSSVWVAL